MSAFRLNVALVCVWLVLLSWSVTGSEASQELELLDTTTDSSSSFIEESLHEAADDAALIELSKLSCPTHAIAAIHLCKVLVRTLRQEGKLRAKVGQGFEVCQIKRFQNENGNLCKNVHDHIAEVGTRWKLEQHYRSSRDPTAFCLEVLAEPVNSRAILSPRTERVCAGKATKQDEKFAREPNAPKGYTGNILEDPFGDDITYINGCRCTCKTPKLRGQSCCSCNKKHKKRHHRRHRKHHKKCAPPKRRIHGKCRLPKHHRPRCPPGQHRRKGVCVIKCPPNHHAVGSKCVFCQAPNKFRHGVCRPPCPAGQHRRKGVCVVRPPKPQPKPQPKPPKPQPKPQPKPVHVPSCKAPGPYHFPYTGYGVRHDEIHVIVDIKRQKIRLYKGTQPFREYVTSTSEVGTGTAVGSLRTPLGQFRISEKFGSTAPLGVDFVALKQTKKYSKESDKSALQTRVITIEGVDAANKNTRKRMVYIHGTNKVHKLGHPASQGCFRLENHDVIDFFNHVHSGTRMFVVPECAWPSSDVVPHKVKH